MKILRLMITFFTRIPVSYPYDYDEKDFIKGIKLLPIIGLIIGILLYAPTLLEGYIHRPILILFIWTIYLFVTGGLHIDGLADTFDGIFSYRKREEMLKIMKDSRIGAFGVLSIIWLLILNLSLSYYIENKFLIIVPIVGRASALLAASISKYAREEGGMGGGFVNNCGVKEGLIGIISSFAIGLIISNTLMALPIFLTFIIVIILTKYMGSRLGGMTGDTIGAIIEISQTMFMFFCYLMIAFG